MKNLRVGACTQFINEETGMMQSQLSQTPEPLIFFFTLPIASMLTSSNELSSSYLRVETWHKSRVRKGNKVKGILRNYCGDGPPEGKEPITLNQFLTWSRIGPRCGKACIN